MNARKSFTLFFALAMTAASAVEARPTVGTNKANGIYTGNGWTSQRVAQSRPSYRYRAPAPSYRYRTPAVQVAPAPMVAQAPIEGRRFSYAPAPSATSSVPCPPGQATASAAAVNGARRFSYAPAPEATVAPAPASAPRVYSRRPSYSGRSGSGSTVPRFPLLKTDPRKYNTR